MSTGFQLYCQPCDAQDNDGPDINWGNEILLRVVRAYPLMVQIGDLTGGDIEYSIQGIWRVPMNFLADHTGAGHRLGVISEYGDQEYPDGEKVPRAKREKQA